MNNTLTIAVFQQHFPRADECAIVCVILWGKGAFENEHYT